MPAEILAPKERLLRRGEIPSVMVCARSLPEAWEASVQAAYEFGVPIPTEYDQKIDPNSKDIGVLIEVADPFIEPRIHKAIPTGLDDLAIYVEEIVHGVADYKVGQGGSYSYHDRLFNYPGIDGWDDIPEVSGRKLELGVDQIQLMVDKLSQVPHSRRAQAITWNPRRDAIHHEPPCLQRVWGRVVKLQEEDATGRYAFDMNAHFRSNDALKAAFMNMFGLTELQKVITEKISEQTGKVVIPGRYVHMVDSYHLYGSYERRGEINRFLQRIASSAFDTRVWRTDDPIVQEEFKRGRQRLADQGLIPLAR